MKQIYEMKGRGHSARAIARELGLARNTVLKYLNSPDSIVPKPRQPRGSKLDSHTGTSTSGCRRDWRTAWSCCGNSGPGDTMGATRSSRITCVPAAASASSKRRYGSRRRRESRPQVDWGSLAYIGADGRKHRIWVFVMVLSWSRACYVELVRRADTAAFIQCHVNAFEYLGGVPRRCLYDNAKVVTLGRDEENRPVWNLRMLDFARRVGFEMRLCRPYRAQTKGKVESGVKYVRRNMWPSICFTDDADLNRQGLEWCDTVANRRVHGTTHRVPQEDVG